MAMPSVPASFTVFLCVLLLLFTSSSARSPLIDDTDHFIFPESDGNNPNGPHTILLPSGRRDSEDFDSDSDSESEPVPFTVVTFHPLQPRFPRRPFPLSYRFRHGYRSKPFNPPLPRRHIPFSDDHDITVHDADDTIFDHLPRWTKFRDVEPSFSHERSAERREEMAKPQDQPQPKHEEKGFIMKIRKFLNRF